MNSQLTSEMISEEELRARLTNYEDPFVERKVHGDIGDCLKTAVAFANSLPDGMPGVIFIPVRNDGTVQPGYNLDELQRSVSKRLSSAYPDLYYFQRVVTVGSEQVIAVVVPGSPERPHFAGQAFVRDGSQSVKASRSQFDALIARRTSIVEELTKQVGKPVRLNWLRQPNSTGKLVTNMFDAEILACTQWWVTLKYFRGPDWCTETYSLRRVHLSFDHIRERLILEVQM